MQNNAFKLIEHHSLTVLGLMTKKLLCRKFKNEFKMFVIFTIGSRRRRNQLTE